MTKSPRFLALRMSPASLSISQPQTPGPPAPSGPEDPRGLSPRGLGGREVLALAEVDDRDAFALDGQPQRRRGLVERHPRPDGRDAVPTKDVERLPEAGQAVVEDVVIGQAGDLERDGGQAVGVDRKPFEDRAALPDGPAGRREGAFAVDDPEIGGPEDREHVPVDRLRVPCDDRLQGPDGRPIGSDEDGILVRLRWHSLPPRSDGGIIDRGRGDCQHAPGLDFGTEGSLLSSSPDQAGKGGPQ